MWARNHVVSCAFFRFIVYVCDTRPRLIQKRNRNRSSGSGKPVTDLSFVEFSNCFVRLAILSLQDKHNTHEDIRGLLRKFTKHLGFDDVDTFTAKLVTLERLRYGDAADLTAKNVEDKLQGVFMEGGDEVAEEPLSAEAEMLRLLRAKHLEIMEAAALGYYRSAEYAAWLAANPSPRIGLSNGKLYTRKNIKGGQWSDKERGSIFDPPRKAEGPIDYDFDLRCGKSPTAIQHLDRVYGKHP